MAEDQTKYSQINLQILHKESILPFLPLMNRWFSISFQKPPYCYAGPCTRELVDPQDLFYVNDPQGLVIIAESDEKVVGIAAGLPFDSKYLQTYLESRHKGAFDEIVKAGFDPSRMFYLTYILTSPEFKERALLSRRIFDVIKNWSAQIGKKQICWQEDVSYSNVSPNEKVENWEKDVGGFITMGVQFKYHWPTLQFDGSIVEAEHTMEFFYKDMQ